MADNYTVLDSVGATLTFGSDDIGPGVHYARKKIGWGPDGTFNDTDNAAGKRLPVNIAESIAIAVTNAALAVLGGGVEAGALRVTIASDSTGVLSIDDNGGSITVDGAGTSAVDDAAFTAAVGSGTPIMGFVTADTVDSGDVGVVAMSSNRNLSVNLAELNAGGSAIASDQGVSTSGTLRVVVAGNDHDNPITHRPLLTGAKASAAAPTDVSADNDLVRLWALRSGALATVLTAAGALIGGDAANGLDVDVTRLPALVAGTANIGDVDIASGPTGASALQVQGAAAHDAAIAGNPVRMGARSNANEPTAVSADDEAVDLWADRIGRQVVLTGHANPEAPVNLNATASGNTTVIAAPGASLSLYICKGSVHNRAATNRLVRLEDGAGGTIRWRAEVAAEGGGAAFDFGSRGWKLTANTLLNVNLDAAGDVDLNVSEFYIAA